MDSIPRTSGVLSKQALRRSRELRHNQTDAEAKLWARLRNRRLSGAKFRRQHPKLGFTADFCCPEHHLIVEVDGSQHFEHAAYDARRTLVLERDGYTVLRFWNTDVLKHTGDVLDAIAERLPAPSPMSHSAGGKL